VAGFRCTPGVHPNGPNARGTYRSAFAQGDRENFASPFLNTNAQSTDRSIRVLYANADELAALFENYGDATHAAHGTTLTWSQFLLWDNIPLWSFLQSMMALYCRHLSASTTLNIIPSDGPCGSHMFIEAVTETDIAASTGRFSPHMSTMEIIGYSRNLALPASDKIDAISCPISLAWIDNATSLILRPQNILARTSPHGTGRIGGPYFHKMPTLQRTHPASPQHAYMSIISSTYHSQTPLRSTIPEA